MCILFLDSVLTGITGRKAGKAKALPFFPVALFCFNLFDLSLAVNSEALPSFNISVVVVFIVLVDFVVGLVVVALAVITCFISLFSVLVYS